VARKHGWGGGGLKLFLGNGNIDLSQELGKILGIYLGKATVGRFADGKVNVMIRENFRGKDVYIIHPSCPRQRKSYGTPPYGQYPQPYQSVKLPSLSPTTIIMPIKLKKIQVCRIPLQHNTYYYHTFLVSLLSRPLPL
jgi:hypothetical protein